jgi:hypothetical protein
MMKAQTGLLAVVRIVERGPGRSSLFHWMVNNHDRLADGWSRGAVRWPALCKQFEALGLTDRTGKPATAWTAKQTWRRARAAVQAARAQQMTGIRKSSPRPAGKPPRHASEPSRAELPAPVVAPPPSVRVAAPIPAPASSADTMQEIEGPVPPDVAQARIAALQKKLNARSGR